jgi:putative transposase
MRYPASEKLEIMRLVEQSHLPPRRTLEKLGVSRATFHRWCDLYQSGGPEALEDRSSRPNRVWNRIPDPMRGQIVQLALDEPELRRENWRRASRTRKVISSRRPRMRITKTIQLDGSHPKAD